MTCETYFAPVIRGKNEAPRSRNRNLGNTVHCLPVQKVQTFTEITVKALLLRGQCDFNVIFQATVLQFLSVSIRGAVFLAPRIKNTQSPMAEYAQLSFLSIPSIQVRVV